MGTPQIILIVLLSVEFALQLVKKVYNVDFGEQTFTNKTISITVILSLLYWGRFFD